MAIQINLYNGIIPYQWQTDTHNYITSVLGKGMIIPILAPRQRYGKSTFAKAELLRHSFARKGAISSYVSPTLKLAVKMYDEICSSCSGLIKEKNAVKMKITFINKSVITFFSAEQGDALRGHTVKDLLVLDESAFIQDSAWTELISPWITVHKPTVLMISTPKYQTGFWYDYYSSDSEYIKIFNWASDYDCPMDEITLSIKSTIPRAKWNSEYLGLFLTSEGAPFQFENCLYDNPNNEYELLYFGLDWGTGSGKDNTVLTMFNEKKEQLKIWKWNDIPPVEQVNKVKSILEGYKQHIKQIVADGTAIGKIYKDMFTTSRLPIKWITFTNDNKVKMIQKLQVAFEQSQIKILNDRDLITELQFFEEQKTPTGKITYNAKKGYKDDIVTAVYLALEGFNSSVNASNFRVIKRK